MHMSAMNHNFFQPAKGSSRRSWNWRRLLFEEKLRLQRQGIFMKVLVGAPLRVIDHPHAR